MKLKKLKLKYKARELVTSIITCLIETSPNDFQISRAFFSVFFPTTSLLNLIANFKKYLRRATPFEHARLLLILKDLNVKCDVNIYAHDRPEFLNVIPQEKLNNR